MANPTYTNEDDQDLEAFENANPMLGGDGQEIESEELENNGTDDTGENDIDADDETSNANATPPATSRKPAKVEKLLSEKNQLAQENALLIARNKELQSQIGTDVSIDEEYIQNKIDMGINKSQLMMMDKLEKDNFYKNNPKAREEAEMLETIMSEHPTLSYDSAYKLHLATNGRSIELVDPASLKKQDKFGIHGSTSNKPVEEESTDDFEQRMQSQHSKGKWTPFVGKAE